MIVFSGTTWKLTSVAQYSTASNTRVQPCYLSLVVRRGAGLNSLFHPVDIVFDGVVFNFFF